MKYFVFSDIHGRCFLLKQALKDAGFDAANSDHCVIGLGDYFDRGPESKEVMEYLMSLPNKVLLMGNHDLYLIEMIRRGWIAKHDAHNGVLETLASFNPDMTKAEIVEHQEKAIKTIVEAGILDFFKSMPYYFKTKQFIFTHAWLPNYIPFEQAPDFVWQEAIQAFGYNLFLDQIQNSLVVLAETGRRLVLGHWYTIYLRKFVANDYAENLHDIWYYKNIIAIDGCTEVSRQVNIFTFEDEPLHILLKKQK